MQFLLAVLFSFVLDCAFGFQYNGTECIGITTFDLLGSTNVEQTDSSVRSVLGFLPMYLRRDCTDSLRMFECQTHYAPHNSNETSQKCCLDVCNVVFENCYDVFAAGYKSDADSIIFFMGILGVNECPQSSEFTDVTPNSTIIATDNCIDLSSVEIDQSDYPQDAPVCPYSTVPQKPDSDYPIPTSGCAIRCHGIMYTEDEYSQLAACIRISGLISLIGMSYVIISQYRRFLSYETEFHKGSCFHIIMVCFGYLIIGLTNTLIEYLDGNASDCEHDSKVAQHSSTCQIQAIIILWFSLWSGAYSSIIMFELYVTVRGFVKKDQLTSKWRKYYLPACFLFSSIPCAILLAVDGVSSLAFSGFPVCLVNIEPNWLMYTVYFAPILVCTCLIAFFCFDLINLTFALFRKKTQITAPIRGSEDSSVTVSRETVDSLETESSDNEIKKVKKKKKSIVSKASLPIEDKDDDDDSRSSNVELTWQAMKATLRSNYQNLILTLLFAAFHFFFFIERLNGNLHNQIIKETASDYVECLMSNSVYSVESGLDECGYHSSYRISMSRMILLCAVLGGYGVIPFLTFGFSYLKRDLMCYEAFVEWKDDISEKMTAKVVPAKEAPYRDGRNVMRMHPASAGNSGANDASLVL